MKKIKAFLLSASLFLAHFVSAAPAPYENPIPNITTIPGLIKAVLSLAVKIGIPISTVFIIWSGFLFVTAAGDEKKIQTAKNTFVWTCIGVGVLLGAWVFATGIEDALLSLTQ